MSPSWGEAGNGPADDTRLCSAGKEESLVAGFGGAFSRQESQTGDLEAASTQGSGSCGCGES